MRPQDLHIPGEERKLMKLPEIPARGLEPGNGHALCLEGEKQLVRPGQRSVGVGVVVGVELSLGPVTQHDRPLHEDVTTPASEEAGH